MADFCQYRKSSWGATGTMGLLTILKMNQKEWELQVLTLSLDNAGKTTIPSRSATGKTSIPPP